MRSGGMRGGNFRWRRAIEVGCATILVLREDKPMGILVRHDGESKVEEEEGGEEEGEEEEVEEEEEMKE